MAQRGVVQSWLFLVVTLLASVSGLPMMPFSMGLMGYGGMGGHRGMLGGHIGSSYKKGSTYGTKANHDAMTPLIVSPTALNGVERFFSTDTQELVEGLSVIIEPATSSMKGSMGHHGAAGMFSPLAGAGLYGGGGGGAGYGYGGLGGGAFGMYGMGHGLMGALGGLNGMKGMGDTQLEATIQILKADNFVPQPAVVVFTESAVTSSTADCPVGPVLIEPIHPDHGLAGGYGFAGSSSMLGGYGSPHMGMNWGMGMGMGMDGEPDFGVIAEVTLQPGLNTFTVKGLGPFTDLKHLAGRGATVCENVQIGMDGHPVCMGAIFGCVKLGYTSDPEELTAPIP